MPQNYLGVDIAKDTLDLYSAAEDRAWQVANRPAELHRLVRELPADCFVVFEATGVYDRALRHALSRAGRPFARINPKRARDFARAIGLLAKTDRVDARMLARLGAALQPEPSREADADRQRLADLLRRRAQLVEYRKQEKNRLRQADLSDIRQDIRSLIDLFSRRIAKCEAAIRSLIQDNDTLQSLTDRLRSAPGVGPVTAATLIAEMPELGQIDRRAVAMLAGLAPIPDDSGQRKGYRKIAGGRANVRRALYLAALAARRHPHFRPFHERLRNAGKQPKTALIATARKLLVTLNAMTRTKTNFQANYA